jgi:hypothetical protein
MDMLFHVRTPATGIACGSNTASLSGKTFGDESFVGRDSIRTVGCKPQGLFAALSCPASSVISFMSAST